MTNMDHCGGEHLDASGRRRRLSGSITGNAAGENTPPSEPEVKSYIVVVDCTSAGQRLADEFDRLEYATARLERIEHAVAFVREHQTAVVVSELRLSDGSGFDLLNALHDEVSTPKVLVSAFMTIHAALHAMKLGACNCLCKPAPAPEVLAAAGVKDAAVGLHAQDAWLSLDAASEAYIRDTLSGYKSISRTARVLGVDRRSLRRRMLRYAKTRAASAEPEVTNLETE
jgi:two-component system response regulator RegA